MIDDNRVYGRQPRFETKNNDAKLGMLGMIGAFIVGTPILLLVFAMLFAVRGWVLTYYWAWFALPLFPGLPTLNIPQAIGLMLVATLATNVTGSRGIKDKYRESWSWWDPVKPFIAWIIGYVLHRFFL